ncbi:MAG: COG1361 S-layer family protein [Candidatus Aenigmatarchaeota archaeon]
MPLVLCLVAAIALSGIAGAASIVRPEIAESSTSLTAMPIRYDPYPAESGRYLRLWIKIENSGTLPETDTKFVLEANYPFMLDPSTPAERSIGTIEPGRQVVLEYKLRVDALALTGEYNTSVWLRQCYDAECAATYSRWPIGIYVRRPNPILDIAAFETKPAAITAGKPFNLTLALQNGGSRIKDVVVRLDLSSLPFGPLSGASERRLESIDAGEDATMKFALIAFGDAEAGTHKVPISISYYDEVGNAFTKEDMLTLIVGGTPEVYIGSEDVAAFRKGAVAEFVVNIVNKGLVDVKFLTIRLGEGEGYRAISPSEVYIGNLEPDDYETAKFKVFVDAEDEVSLPFELSYMDALNNEYSETKRLAYYVLSDEEAARFGIYRPDSGWIFFAILGLLAIYAIYRIKRKK